MTIPLDEAFKSLLVVKMTAYDPRGEQPWQLRAAIDTGASSVMIPVEVALALGYSLDDAEKGRVVTGEGVVYAPRIILGRAEVGGATATEVEALCHDLPEDCLVDALVGLSFLTRFHVGFDFDAWEMELTPRG